MRILERQFWCNALHEFEKARTDAAMHRVKYIFENRNDTKKEDNENV